MSQEKQNAPRSESLGASNTNSRSSVQSTAYCNCPRSGDLWRCPIGGSSECAPGGGCCALWATAEATGRETWDGIAERALEDRPCRCGEAGVGQTGTSAESVPVRGMSLEDWNSNIVFPLHDYEMSRACGHCGHRRGRIDRKNGQDVVTCQSCGRYVYNASRAETGLPG
jgi:hypothetical protein